MSKTFKRLLRLMVNSLYVILGVVFVWRGAWVILDIVDHRWFGGNDFIFAVALIAGGIWLMYLHDHRYDNLDHF
mgnify:FL=1